MEIDIFTAENILDILLQGEFITKEEIEEQDDGERIALAQYWIEQAEKAWVENYSEAKNNEVIKTVLNLSPKGMPVREQRTYAAANDDKLPIPREPDFEYKHLPADFTEMTDHEIRKYSSHNQHFLNRARYLLANTTNHLADATHLRDDAYRTAYQKYTYEVINQDIRPTKDLIDTYAKEDENYVRYDTDVKEAQKNVTSYKALIEIYSGNVERLSREWTMRQNEWEKGR